MKKEANIKKIFNIIVKLILFIIDLILIFILFIYSYKLFKGEILNKTQLYTFSILMTILLLKIALETLYLLKRKNKNAN